MAGKSIRLITYQANDANAQTSATVALVSAEFLADSPATGAPTGAR